MHLHGGVAPAPELEGGGKDGVEVTPAGGEGGAHHRGRDEAVNGSRIPSDKLLGNLKWTTCLLWVTRSDIIFLIKVILRFFESNETRSKTTDESGDSLNDCTVQHRHSQVSRAHLDIHP